MAPLCVSEPMKNGVPLAPKRPTSASHGRPGAAHFVDAVHLRLPSGVQPGLDALVWTIPQALILYEKLVAG